MNNKRYAVLELSDLQKALGIKGVFGNWIARMAYRILELEEVNRIHDKFHESKGAAFSANVLKEVGVTCDIPSHQLERIPSEGGFLTISNHHFGGLDGLILSSVIGSRRSEYKILTTFLLSMIPNLKESFLGVDNFSSGGTRSVSGIRAALGHRSRIPRRKTHLPLLIRLPQDQGTTVSRVFGVLSVKRTVKYHKVFRSGASFADAPVSLGGKLPCPHFQRRQNPGISLYVPGAAGINIAFIACLTVTVCKLVKPCTHILKF